MKKNLTIMATVVLVVIIFLVLKPGIYLPMTGTVIDAEIGRPIEGAVVLVEWAKIKGIGLTYTEPYKVVEAVSDKQGKFTITGVFDPFVNPPRMTVYKKGYIAWNNEYIFPTWEKRSDFKWVHKIVIRLRPFSKEYSRAEHVYFLQSVTHWGKLINDAYRWEELEKEQQK